MPEPAAVDSDNLPVPRPSLNPAPPMDHRFEALGWLLRGAQSVGSIRFAEWITGRPNTEKGLNLRPLGYELNYVVAQCFS